MLYVLTTSIHQDIECLGNIRLILRTERKATQNIFSSQKDIFLSEYFKIYTFSLKYAITP